MTCWAWWTEAQTSTHLDDILETVVNWIGVDWTIVFQGISPARQKLTYLVLHNINSKPPEIISLTLVGNIST